MNPPATLGRPLLVACFLASILPGTQAAPAQLPPGAPVVFDDFEDQNFGGWEVFTSADAGAGVAVEDDRPQEGFVYLATRWNGEGSTGGFFGGLVRNLDDDAQLTLPADPWFNVWVLPRSETTADRYTLEITLREDTDGDGWTDGVDDSRRFDTVFTRADADDRWRLLSAPVADFIDLGTGGDGRWNGRLDELVVVIAAVEGSGRVDVEVDFDYFAFTAGGPLVPTLQRAVFDDFEDGDASDWFFFGGNDAGGGGGTFDDRPKEGSFYLSTGWGGRGSASVFYGGLFKNLDDDAQLAMPLDPWFNVWVYNQSDATADAYTLEVTIREDTDGDGWTDGAEDSLRLDTVFPRSEFVGEWVLVSAPLADFSDLRTGGNGRFDGKLDELVVVISGVEGADGATVEVDFDELVFTAGGPLAAPFPPTMLALQDGRFRLEVDWQIGPQSGEAEAVALTDDTGTFWFFNPDNAEILVKVLDACNLEGFHNFWVFSAGLTNLEYRLRVTDFQTGQRYVVFNREGFVAPPVLSTHTLFRQCDDGDGSGLPGSQSIDTSAVAPATVPEIRQSQDDDLVGPCVAGDEAICLTGGRFRVSATWRDFAGNSGAAKMVPLAADSGAATFFSESNVELLFKVLDACSLPDFGRFWPFVTGLTNVEVDLEIVDTWSGKLYAVHNPPGAVFPTVLDAESFLDDCALEPPP